ncbi:MAG TPA: 2-amino-4-hydroxy-6-hydroxymethyldihydropteridine diphosphokinase [Dehalococcoidia bacterium]|nr:2-amino-4-hydroxy-6-hydroxymethyldihydropteridine diphosphokinase [Dehalococcoidia bacterium]
MSNVYIGLGANLGDRRENLRSALRMMPQEVRIDAMSSLYETEPVTPDGAEQPMYYNAAARLETRMEARELLDALQAIEGALGRLADVPRWSPRPIDIDILLFGDEIISEPGLTIPHPRMTKRAFVLVPLVDIAAEVVHPVEGRPVKELAEETGSGGVRLVEGRGWADG